MNNKDALLRYCTALDAGNFEEVGIILEQAQHDEALEAAIIALHARLDSQESFTQQLQRIREQLQEQEPQS